MSGGEASAAAAADATAGGTRGLQANTSAGRSSAGRAVLLVDVEDEHEDGTKAAPDTKVIAGINKYLQQRSHKGSPAPGALEGTMRRGGGPDNDDDDEEDYYYVTRGTLKSTSEALVEVLSETAQPLAAAAAGGSPKQQQGQKGDPHAKAPGT